MSILVILPRVSGEVSVICRLSSGKFPNLSRVKDVYRGLLYVISMVVLGARGKFICKEKVSVARWGSVDGEGLVGCSLLCINFCVFDDLFHCLELKGVLVSWRG